MPSQPISDSPPVEWVAFADNSAVLRRMIRSNGARGLLLQFARGSQHADTRRRALEAGFLDFGETGDVYLMAPEKPSRFDARKMARILGSSVVLISRSRLESYPWTVDYRESDLGRGRIEGRAVPGRPEFIGRNFHGEDVFRHHSGTRFRKIRDGGGKSRQVEEAGPRSGPEYLRAASREDLQAIAAGLLSMAGKGPLDNSDLRRVAAAVVEGANQADAMPTLEDVQSILKDRLLEMVVETTMEEGDSRSSYHKAVRLADNAQALIDSAPADDGGQLNPSVFLLIFLRRLTSQVQEIDLLGNSRLGISAPKLKNSRHPQHQLYDLTDGDRSGLHERVLNILGRRQDDGTSMLLLDGGAGEEHVAGVRSVIGKGHAIEVVAEIAPVVAVGRHEGPSVSLIIVGERRPSPNESLPQAARRTFSVFGRDDLDRLHVEILRSRRKIRDWHAAVERTAGQEDPERQDNLRQCPYVPLSRASSPFTMVPKSLEASTAKALRRVAGDVERHGGIDAAVAGMLGMPVGELGTILTAEQVDAVAMRQSAGIRERAFLLADQTGVGKGRSLAAMVYHRLREGGKVLYLTENAEINIRDVWRDLGAVGALDAVRPAILAARHVELMTVATTGVPPGKTAKPPGYVTLPAATRRTILESGDWPAGCNLVITNYSQFNRGPDSPAGRWAGAALDDSTLLVLDESHNAINPGANTGKAVRTMIESVGPGNVVFATATPMRNPAGADLYRPLLPAVENRRFDSSLDDLVPGGETAQESFTTMLSEDGVFLRRDHDLSTVEFEIRLPDDQQIAGYQEIMNRFSPLVELMIDASLRVGSLIGRAQSRRYAQMVADGLDEETARAQCRALFQYSGAVGGPLVRLARVAINAIKVDQVVEEVLNEIREGRKPLITFHSTSASLLNEIAADRQEMMETPLSLSDQIVRVAESIFRIKYEDTIQDARERSPEIRAISERMSELIARLPADLPVSPVDAVIEKLTAEGHVVGEISGRTLAYRGQRIVRREGTDRRSVVDSFNDGGTDVLIYNMAGATGGSYHAAPEFGDRRPRTLIEMETPVDIIKYIQAQGRGNRYGQVARPRIVSVMTGLIPEMRILQQRNRKLRALGASVDGNRSHPLLLDDVPDFLNKVGDLATTQVLRSLPGLARRLGFREFVSGSGDEQEAPVGEMPNDSGASGSVIESIANRVLSRSLVLPAVEQTRLIDLIRIEFEAIVEELESRNANPLRPKEISGEIEIHGTTLYSGLDRDDDDLETSAFAAPLYMSTGTHHLNEEPITGDQLLQMVGRARIAAGSDGFAPYASRVEAMLPTLLGHLVRQDSTISEALAAPDRQPFNFRSRHHRLVRFIGMLRSIRPGAVVQMDGEDGEHDGLLRTIVGLTAPADDHVHLPQAYRIRAVAPGDQRPQIHTLKRLLSFRPEAVRILPGIEDGDNVHHIRGFAQQLALGRRYPVQVLNGNLLAAITEAQRHRLGTMCLYREQDGGLRRGIVVRQSKVNLEYLPAVIPSARIAAGLVARHLASESDTRLTIWIGQRTSPDFSISIEAVSGRNDGFGPLVRLQATRSFRRSLPDFASVFGTRARTAFRLANGASKVEEILSALDGQDLLTDGLHRPDVNELIGIIDESGTLPPHLDLGRLYPADAEADVENGQPGHGRETADCSLAALPA